VAALVALELMLLLAAWIFLDRAVGDFNPATLAGAVTEQIGPQVSPFLEGESPDTEAVDRWLRGVGRYGVVGTEDTSPEAVRLAIVGGMLSDTRTRLLVLDEDLRVVGDLRQDRPPARARRLSRGEASGLAPLLQRALAGERDPERLYTQPYPHTVTVASPLRDEGGEVVGALALSGPWTQDFGNPGLWDSLRFVALSALAFTVAAGLIGSLFGYFTARKLVRRLNRVAGTAAAWGAGDFSRFVRDNSGDELGQLGRQLNRMAERLRDLIHTREQLSAVDERNRLARDLHDSVKQQLFAANMLLATARDSWSDDPDRAKRRLDSACELVQQSQRELTTVIQMLRPVQLKGRGLRDALGDHISRWSDQTAIGVRYEVRGEARVPLPVEEALYRVAQESLANVARHSGASAVEVELDLRPSMAELRVSDDGRGFDPASRTVGMGLDSMRERLRALGGELSITSGSGGSCLVARTPVGDAGEAE
jgi:signal transduction histidine kinase